MIRGDETAARRQLPTSQRWVGRCGQPYDGSLFGNRRVGHLTMHGYEPVLNHVALLPEEREELDDDWIVQPRPKRGVVIGEWDEILPGVPDDWWTGAGIAVLNAPQKKPRHLKMVPSAQPHQVSPSLYREAERRAVSDLIDAHAEEYESLLVRHLAESEEVAS